MARPTEFDREQVLEHALKLFWCQGYGATTLNQLLDAMQIGRSSFYAAFGDKRALFIEVLSLFAARTREILLGARREAGAQDALRRFFYDTLLAVPRYRAGRGCMMVNTVLELADVDEELSARAARELARIEADFEDLFQELMGEQIVPADRSAAELAAHVMVLNQGFRVSSRKTVSRRVLKNQIDTALSILGLPDPS